VVERAVLSPLPAWFWQSAGAAILFGFIYVVAWEMKIASDAASKGELKGARWAQPLFGIPTRETFRLALRHKIAAGDRAARRLRLVKWSLLICLCLLVVWPKA
jgi:hypothetical protein